MSDMEEGSSPVQNPEIFEIFEIFQGRFWHTQGGNLGSLGNNFGEVLE